jgi:hypothetical protein
MEVYKKHRPFNRFYKTLDEYNSSIKHEVKLLQLLEREFINEPKIDHYPFSKLIDTELCTKHHKINISENKYRGRVGDCHILIQTHCGKNALTNAEHVKIQKNIQPINLNNTIECIINNLRNTCILRTDLHPGNLCINSLGQVSLIDFKITAEIASMEYIKEYYKKPNLKDFKNELYNYVGCAESDHLIEKSLTSFYFKEKNHNDESPPQLIKKMKWTNGRFFKKSPWSMLYYF